ncbi:MAG: lysylphosphatidylglycerol synthase transmembrane domain-containing protein [Acetobacterium sp.]
MDQSEKKKKRWFSKILKKYSNYIFFVFLIGATALVILTQVDPITFINTLKEAKIGYLLLGIGCIFIYFGLEAYMLLILLRRENPNEKISFAWTLTMIGQYYNLITPSATGGQPLQLYEMSKKGYFLGVGTAVLVQKYALYQVTVTFLAIIATIFSITSLHRSLDAAKWLIAIGLIVNIAGVVLIFILAFSPKAAKTIMMGCVRLLFKLHVLKNAEKYYEKVELFIAEYRIAIEALKNNKMQTFKLFLMSVMQIVVLYSVNYWVYCSLGLAEINAITIISLQAILYVAVAFIPTPGASGGAEAGFLLIFGPIYGAGNTAVAMILWRIITFYFIILFGGIYLSIHSIRIGRNKLKCIENELTHEVEQSFNENENKENK